MTALSKAQILKTTHCRFFLWHTSIDCCEVSKKALRRSLRSGRTYSAEITQQGTYEHGRNLAGKPYYTCIIILN
jgi:hypothetical protein